MWEHNQIYLVRDDLLCLRVVARCHATCEWFGSGCFARSFPCYFHNGQVHIGVGFPGFETRFVVASITCFLGNGQSRPW